jgi:hypothetical protein
MEFYFPIKDGPFHWVRASSLYSPPARQRQLFARTQFRGEAIGTSIPVFSRADTTRYYKTLYSLCLSAGVPYVADLDDLYWDLPGFSNDLTLRQAGHLEFLDGLVSRAAVIIASTPELKEELKRRFPHRPVFLVENSPPASVAPRYGVLIANSDSFKMGGDQMRWFIDLLRLVFGHGLSIQLLGHNQNLLDLCGDILVHSFGLVDYPSYLLGLSRSHYRLALIPVEHSRYADCKSAIKAIEFLSQRIQIVASDVAPYRRFAELHDREYFCVVPNTLAAWQQAVESVIFQIPEYERERGKKINAILLSARDNQLEQWLAVADFLHDRQPDPATMRRLVRKLSAIEIVYNTFRPLVGPIRRQLRKLRRGRSRVPESGRDP